MPKKDTSKVPSKPKVAKPRKVKIEDDLYEIIAKEALSKLQEELEESAEPELSGSAKELPPVQMLATEDQELDDLDDKSLDEKILPFDDKETSDIDNGGGLILVGPPPKGWADGDKVKFHQGDLVVPVELKTTKDFEPWTITGPGKDPNTYFVRKSRIQSETIVKEHTLKFAPKDCKPYVSYWEHTDPFKSFGNFKISCPSNPKK
jgi:hypothetical protein